MKVPDSRITAFSRYTLAFNDGFEAPVLDTSRWLPDYLPQWSSRAATEARYTLTGDSLILHILDDQQPWSPEFNGNVRVSSLQTGVFSGPIGTKLGQHRFTPDCIVREAQEPARLYTPQYGYFELRAKCRIAPHNVAALWMIGFEDVPERSGEICIFELKGGNVGAHQATIGYGIHPFGDPALVDEFYEEAFALDVTEFNTYAAEWTPTAVHFFINGAHVRTIDQSPAYTMQFMLNLYDLENVPSAGSEFVVDYVAGYEPMGR